LLIGFDCLPTDKKNQLPRDPAGNHVEILIDQSINDVPGNAFRETGDCLLGHTRCDQS